MASRPEKQRPLPARTRMHFMARHASSGIRFTRPSSAATPNLGLTSYSKEPQKVTPWKNYLAETKPPNGFFARPPVTPWRGRSEPFFCIIRRARSPETPRPILPSLAPSDSCPFRRVFPPDGTGHPHSALIQDSLALHRKAVRRMLAAGRQTQKREIKRT
jgi:hypothetical protein